MMMIIIFYRFIFVTCMFRNDHSTNNVECLSTIFQQRYHNNVLLMKNQISQQHQSSLNTHYDIHYIFNHQQTKARRRNRSPSSSLLSSSSLSQDDSLSNMNHITNNQLPSRRRDCFKKIGYMTSLFVTPLIVTSLLPSLAVADDEETSLLELVRIARQQLAPIPDLIEKEQWDSVRAILIKPPLSDCWTKRSNRFIKAPLLQQYASNVSNDELSALEIKEELESHLRFLDMSVYNNVFNPIKTVGTTGATKALIRSYYEDPINEYKASIQYLDELIKLAN